MQHRRRNLGGNQSVNQYSRYQPPGALRSLTPPRRHAKRRYFHNGAATGDHKRVWPATGAVARAATAVVGGSSDASRAGPVAKPAEAGRQTAVAGAAAAGSSTEQAAAQMTSRRSNDTGDSSKRYGRRSPPLPSHIEDLKHTADAAAEGGPQAQRWWLAQKV